MDPKITITSEENNTLYFNISNLNHSLANSLRRIILSEIPTIVFRTFPHSENKVEIISNTSRFNNEILKQRIGCIPIHINDTDFPLQDYIIELEMKNNSDNIQLITTEHFKIKNIINGQYLSDKAVKEIFPPDSITNDYIPITRLRPKLSDNLKGEELILTSTLDIGTAKQDGMYNVVSTCGYGATVDKVKANDIWNDKIKELEKEGMTEEEIKFEKENWFLLEGKRITIPDSFDFTIENIGVFTNFEIVFKACDIMISKCNKFISLIENNEIEIKKNEDTTVNNEYIVTMENEDYTLGNALVYFLYEDFYLKDKLSFVGFRIPHPHIPKGILRISFDTITDDHITLNEYLINSAKQVINVFSKIQSNFK
jgi:DNA-directed RNA polymerase II subunit RPB3